MMANAGGGSWTWVWPAARRRVGVVGLVACLAISDVGRCCDNPVFRYALENWPSAEYLLVTAGAEAAADAARIDQLLAVAEPRPNLRLASAGELPQLDASGPLVLVAPPPPRGQPGRPQVTWSGPASEESLARVVDSPARRELAKRLLDGEAIVWVVLEVSDREAIDKGEAALQQLIDGYLEALAQAEAAAAASAWASASRYPSMSCWSAASPLSIASRSLTSSTTHTIASPSSSRLASSRRAGESTTRANDSSDAGPDHVTWGRPGCPRGGGGATSTSGPLASSCGSSPAEASRRLGRGSATASSWSIRAASAAASAPAVTRRYSADGQFSSA